MGYLSLFVIAVILVYVVTQNIMDYRAEKRFVRETENYLKKPMED